MGDLTLDRGRTGKKNDPDHSSGHGVKHALEERHKISPQQIAQTLLGGKVEQHESFPSRLHVSLGDHTVVLEREVQAGSMRSSSTRAKLHTAYAGKNKSGTGCRFYAGVPQILISGYSHIVLGMRHGKVPSGLSS